MSPSLWIRLSFCDFRALHDALEAKTSFPLIFNAVRCADVLYLYSATSFFYSVVPYLKPEEEGGTVSGAIFPGDDGLFAAGMEPEKEEDISWYVDGSLFFSPEKDREEPETIFPEERLLQRLVSSSLVSCRLKGASQLFSGRDGAGYGSLRISVAAPDSYLSSSWMGEGEAERAMEKRTLLLFGRGGMKKIRSLPIGCIGAGGLANHFITAAMHLGINSFILLDDDRLEESNLNRFLGAVKKDAGSFKTDLLKREILGLHPGGKVEVAHELFPRKESLSLLQGADVLVSAVDDDAARRLIQVYALATHRPLVDMGAGIFQNQEGRIDEWGGQWRLSVPGGPCLACMGLSPAEADTCLPRQKGYLAGTGITPASIVTLNMTVASQALSLMARYVVGDAPPVRHVKYDEQRMQILRISEKRSPFCPLCGSYDDAL